ncbi:MAG: DUF1566 domain-containing protein [Reinekea sp.]
MTLRFNGSIALSFVFLFFTLQSANLFSEASFDYNATGTTNGEQMLGTNERDLIDGLAGDDTLYGFAGDDQLIGGEGEDRLQGGNGSKTGSDNDYLIGGADHDILMGEDGNDTLEGGTGGDHYYYTSGQDTLIDPDSGDDILFFLDAAKADLTFHRNADDLVIIVSGNPDNSVTVSQFFALAGAQLSVQPNGGYLIPAAQIMDLITEDPGTGSGGDGSADGGSGNDGSGSDHSTNDTIPAAAISGTEHEDIVIGTDANDDLFGDQHNDILLGVAGDDTYYIRAGDGQDTIIDSSGTNRIYFTESLTFSDVSSGFSRYSNDLVLKIGSGDQQVTVQSFFTLSHTVASLVFSSGQTVSAAQIFDLFGAVAPTATRNASPVFIGTGNPDNIMGSEMADIIVTGMAQDRLRPLSGDDLLIGGEADDVYEISPDGGHDIIIDSAGSNTLRFLTGIDSSDVFSSMQKSADDLVLNYENGRASITVYQFFARLNTISTFAFSDASAETTAESIWSAFGVSAPTERSLIYDMLTGVAPDSGSENQDGDRDGVNDAADLCPFTNEGESVDANGCALSQLDSDNDSIDDARDLCPGTESGWKTDGNGCSEAQLDADADGVMNAYDDCPATPTDESADANGCAPSQKDADNDGVADYQDQCPNTTLGESELTDEQGCADYQLDDDNDGLSNRLDACPGTDPGLETNTQGCAANQRDLDSDGITDEVDTDIDGDGVENDSDQFPEDPSEYQDSDSDGQGNQADPDDDNDSYTDEEELAQGTDPLDWQSNPWAQKAIKSYTPKTGERISLYPGDDGSLQLGMPKIFYRDDAKEVVYDRLSGLIWQDDERVKTKGWGRCEHLELAGISDWRLPNRLELLFLIDYYKETENDSYLHSAFKNVFLKRYPSLTDNYRVRSNWDDYRGYNFAVPHGVDFMAGQFTASDDSFEGYDRCVSGPEQFMPDFKRADNLDVSVDQTSMLMFEDGVQVEENYGTAEDAIQYCNNLEFAGYSDWRLPNLNESHILLTEFDLRSSDKQNPEAFKYVSAHADNFSEKGYWLSSTPNYGSARYFPSTHTADNVKGFWHFKYRDFGDIASGLTWNFYHQQYSDSDDQYGYRCVRTYVMALFDVQVGNTDLNEGEALKINADATSIPGHSIGRVEWTYSIGIFNVGVVGTDINLDITTLDPGPGRLTLTVWDENGVPYEYDQQIPVNINGTPEAKITGNNVIDYGQSLTLSSAYSYDDHSIVKYQWHQLPENRLLSEEAELVLNRMTQSTRIQLTVTDGAGLTDSDTMFVLVENIPTEETDPPEISVSGNTHYGYGDTIDIDASQSSDESGIKAFRWYLVDGNARELIANSARLQYPADVLGDSIYELEVEDNTGLISSQRYTIYVQYRPTAILPANLSFYADMAIELDGGRSYSQSGTMYYVWMIDGNMAGYSKTIRVNNLGLGEHDITLQVSSDSSGFISDTVTGSLTILPTRVFESCPVNNYHNDDSIDPAYPETDILWSGENAATVAQIEQAFNRARRQDPSAHQYLNMPSQKVWDAMSLQQQGLYLINAEREARGIKPYEAASTEVANVASDYANYLLTQNQVIGHYNDGRSPTARLNSNSYIDTYSNVTTYPESLAVTHSGEQYSQSYAIVRAIYMWLYEDQEWYKNFGQTSGDAWIHRDHLLQQHLTEDFGTDQAEGLIGFGLASGLYDPATQSPDINKTVVVLNSVDQHTDWTALDLATANTASAQVCVVDAELDIDIADSTLENLQKIKIIPDTLHLMQDQSEEIDVIGIMQDGSEQDLTFKARFIADINSVVKIENGRITALQQGRAKVRASIAGVTSEQLFVTVAQPTNTDNLLGTDAEQWMQYLPDNASVEQYDPFALSLYTGVVVDRDNQPLQNVQISLVSKPEYGSVLTDADGRFLFSAQAGDQSLLFEKAGFLTVQRKSVGQSNSWNVVDDVRLLPYDSKETLIDLSLGTTQVHESSLVSDEFGSRKATVVFNGISSATVTEADGSSYPLNSFWMSATEYETPDSMPGDLPENSAFTYCTELHISGLRYNDSVHFDNDVVMFIDNFLGFDVGEIVPIGYFDQLDSQWQASKNGVIVRLLDSDSDGIVDGLDINDDGIADDLNDNGNVLDDAIGLDSYSAGTTLMWGAFNHFTPIDYNWASMGGYAPQSVEPQVGEQQCNYESVATGSYVKPFQLSFHEDIPLTGTGMALHYSSQRTADYKHEIIIQVVGSDVPTGLYKMHVVVEVAGHVFHKKYSPIANTEASFLWDGTDLHGKRIPGYVNANVSIGYEYQVDYASAGNVISSGGMPSSYPNAWALLGNGSTGVPARTSLILWQHNRHKIKNNFPSQIAEGWSLSSVHEFDSDGRLYLGDGNVVDVPTQSILLKTGQTTTVTEFDDGHYKAGGKTIHYSVNADGFMVDEVTGLIWEFTDAPKLVTDKSSAEAHCVALSKYDDYLWRVPTTKEIAYSMEKSGRDLAPYVYNMRKASDLWHRDSANPDRRRHPLLCVSSKNISQIGEKLNDISVTGLLRDTANETVIDKATGLMWQDTYDNKSVKVTWSQAIDYCEASNHAGFDDWRLPNINELLYALPNSIFEHQTELVVPSDRVWRYNVSFRKPYWSATSNAESIDKAWGIESVSFNSPYFDKEDPLHVRCVRSADSAKQLPYVFNERGQLIKTIDLTTGDTQLTYGYDSQSNLVSITDRFNNAVTIERAYDGQAEAIIGTDGQRTELVIDYANRLKSIIYDDDSNYQFVYDGSLLTEKTDPNGNKFTHHFDTDGRVEYTTDMEGGQWDFFDIRSPGHGNNQYGYSTAEGNRYTTSRRTLYDGTVEKQITQENGLQTITSTSEDYLTQSIEQCGVVTTIENVLDEKTKTPIPSTMTVTLPSGLTSVTKLSKTFASDGADTMVYTLTSEQDGIISRPRTAKQRHHTG